MGIYPVGDVAHGMPKNQLPVEVIDSGIRHQSGAGMPCVMWAVVHAIAGHQVFPAPRVEVVKVICRATWSRVEVGAALVKVCLKEWDKLFMDRDDAVCSGICLHATGKVTFPKVDVLGLKRKELAHT